MAVIIFGIIFFGLACPTAWFFEETKAGNRAWDWLEANVFHDED